jgi:hypothetical protein
MRQPPAVVQPIVRGCSLPVARCFDETEPETTPLPARERIVLDGLRRDLDAREVAER